MLTTEERNKIESKIKENKDMRASYGVEWFGNPSLYDGLTAEIAELEATIQYDDIEKKALEEEKENAQTLYDTFMEDDPDEIFRLAGIDEEEICQTAFEDNVYCTCTSNGSPAYFDRIQMQWYPGDDYEYEVTGYDKYKNEIAEEVAYNIAKYYNTTATGSFIELIKENLSELCPDGFLNEQRFEQKAIDEYEAEEPDYDEDTRFIDYD